MAASLERKHGFVAGLLGIYDGSDQVPVSLLAWLLVHTAVVTFSFSFNLYGMEPQRHHGNIPQRCEEEAAQQDEGAINTPGRVP